MGTFRYLTAEQWGMRWQNPPVRQVMPVSELYVHHTAGNDFGDTTAEVAFRWINEYAIRDGYKLVNGVWKYTMSAVDYSILVHRNEHTDVTTIGEARGEWMPAATKDRNTISKAVCAMGYFHPDHSLSRQPHPDMLEGIARGLALCVEADWARRDSVIFGHRQNPSHPGATVCPGNFLYAKLPEIRTRVAQLLTPPEEDPMTEPKLYLAFKKDDRDQLWRGDGCQSTQIDSATQVGMMGRPFTDPRMQRYFNPNTGRQLTSWIEVPELTPNQIIADLGTPT